MRSLVKLYFITLILFLFPYYKGMAQTAPSLVINEMMINSNNVASLPSFEYIELFNNSQQTIDLKTITLHINNNQQLLPNYKIAPNQYVILCSQESTTQFSRYGNAVPLQRWYALNNTAATIQITQNDNLLDEVTYRDNWYNSSSKRNGGWSLERINPNWNCNINLNWSATNSLTGGTPGKANTILDKKFIPKPHVTHYQIIQNRVNIRLNLAISYFSNIEEATFYLDDGIGNANQIVHLDEQIELTFPKNIDPQKLYTLKITGLKICNLLLTDFQTKLFEQQDLKAGDVIINEILFNPKEGGVDFVELYNTATFPINLQNFRLGNRIILEEFYLLAPNQYLAVTTNKKTIKQHYPNAVDENILEISSMPPYTNQQGNVTLYTPQNTLLDSLYYTASMHAAHLIDPKGVSLERTSIVQPAFHSASTLHGGATPGYQNSTMDIAIGQNKISLASKTISPNGDGYEDQLEIIYELVDPNYIINVDIYNDKGQLIKKIAQQNLAGTHGRLVWDGTNNFGTPCAKGHYICLTHIFNHEGKTQNFKQPFVLINSLTRH